MGFELLDYLCCPKCKSHLKKRGPFLICQSGCKDKYEIVEGNIVKIIPDLTPDLELSIKKWDAFYRKQLGDKSYLKEREDYLRLYFPDEYRQIQEYKKINKDVVYLEIGCGPMIFGQQIAEKCKLVIGIDFSISSLKIAQKCFEERGIKNYLLVLGDIKQMPLKENKIDLVFGGGVIEHFRDTQQVVDEIYRVLKRNGISFNTVPCLNIGSLYRQFWGNIPNLPALRQIAEFIHIGLLKGKHMTFGYEFSFLGSTLKKIHKNSGFRKVDVNKFDVEMVLDLVPNQALKKLFIYLADNSRLFWPMIKIIGQK